MNTIVAIYDHDMYLSIPCKDVKHRVDQVLLLSSLTSFLVRFDGDDGQHKRYVAPHQMSRPAEHHHDDWGRENPRCYEYCQWKSVSSAFGYWFQSSFISIQWPFLLLCFCISTWIACSCSLYFWAIFTKLSLQASDGFRGVDQFWGTDRTAQVPGFDGQIKRKRRTSPVN